jgi:hypothetical protein
MNSELAIKEVKYQNITMTACQKNTNEIYVGVKSICDGLGIDYSSQLKRIARSDILPRGMVKMTIPSVSGDQETNMLDISYLPYFLIGIKSSMVKLEFRDKILNFKLEAKDVLAKAFLHKPPANYNEILRALTNNQKVLIKNQRALIQKVHALENDNKVLLFPMAKEVNKLKDREVPDGEPYILYNRLHDALCDIDEFIGKYEDNSILSCNDRAFKNIINACVRFAAKKRHTYTGVIWRELYAGLDQKHALSEIATDFTLRAQIINRVTDILR